MIKHKSAKFQVYLLTAFILMVSLTSCSGIQTVGEYDPTQFKDTLRADENILLYDERVSMSLGGLGNRLLLTDERVILGVASWDYTEIISVKIVGMTYCRIPFMCNVIRMNIRRESNESYTIDFIAGIRDERKIKRLIQARLDYVEKIRQELKQREAGESNAQELDATIMAELRRRRGEGTQRKRDVALSQFGTIGIVTASIGDPDIKRECEGTSLGGSTGTPLDVIIVPIWIVVATSEWAECASEKGEELKTAMANLQQALKYASETDQFGQRVDTAAGNRLDNPIVRRRDSLQPREYPKLAENGIDTIIEITPFAILNKHGKPEGNSYSLFMKLRFRIIDAKNGHIVRDEELRHTGGESELSNLSFKTALDTGFDDLAEQLAKNVLDAAADD